MSTNKYYKSKKKVKKKRKFSVTLIFTFNAADRKEAEREYVKFINESNFLDGRDLKFHSLK